MMLGAVESNHHAFDSYIDRPECFLYTAHDRGSHGPAVYRSRSWCVS